jgi:DNA-directed RNA polymerase specialized sigma24 family protein
MNKTEVPGRNTPDYSDAALLRRYAETESRAAFSALVERHLGFVNAVCMRGLDNRQMAEDATQVVFIILARKARTLSSGVFLPAWLFHTARLTAHNMRRREGRRARYERQAAGETQTPQTASTVIPGP